MLEQEARKIQQKITALPAMVLGNFQHQLVPMNVLTVQRGGTKIKQVLIQFVRSAQRVNTTTPQAKGHVKPAVKGITQPKRVLPQQNAVLAP